VSKTNETPKIEQSYWLRVKFGPKTLLLGVKSKVWENEVTPMHHFLVKLSLSQLKKLPCPKVDMPYLITYLCRTCVFEWHAVRCGFKHRYKKTHVLGPFFIFRAFEFTIINICFD